MKYQTRKAKDRTGLDRVKYAKRRDPYFNRGPKWAVKPKSEKTYFLTSHRKTKITLPHVTIQDDE